MITPTLQQFKKFCKANKALAEAVCLAQAFAECERKRVDAYIKPVFDSFKFDGIESPRDLYLCEDDAKCAEYYAACDVAHRANGFKGEAGYCPALIAESLYIDAQNAMLKIGCEFLGVNIESLWKMENRRQMLDLLLGACLKKDEKLAA